MEDFILPKGRKLLWQVHSGNAQTPVSDGPAAQGGRQVGVVRGVPARVQPFS